MSDIKLKVNGISYGGWTSIKVVQSMDQVCGSFAFGCSDEFPGKPTGWDMSMGDFCQVIVDGSILCSGYIDEMPISYDHISHSIQVSGRDSTAALVDCSFVDPNNNVNEWNDQAILKLIKNICDPFEITVIVDSSVGSDLSEQLKKFAANEGDKAFDSLLKLCKHKAVIPLSYGDGRLTLTRAGSREATDALELGVNILSGSLEQTNKERYSKYIVKGQSNESAPWELDSITEPNGEAIDTIIGGKLYRPLVILLDGEVNAGQCKDAAYFEARNRAGRSRSITYKVQGWTQSDGTPWLLNSMVQIKDNFFSLNDTRLISGLVFSLNDSNGELTEITVVNKETYELRAEPVVIEEEFDFG